MAEKKTASRAEQAVSGAKKKTSSGSASKPSGKKSTPAKNTKYKTEYERAVPPHFLIAAVSILLFALFVVISVNPDGKLLEIIKSVVLDCYTCSSSTPLAGKTPRPCGASAHCSSFFCAGAFTTLPCRSRRCRRALP